MLFKHCTLLALVISVAAHLTSADSGANSTTCQCIQDVGSNMSRCPGSSWNMDVAGYRGNCKRKHEYRTGECVCSGCFTCQDVDLR
ncbi:hypothetical protein V8B55DRAFT_1555308 [Mucor lusitanicus]|uniref:Neuroparsin n=1 Tax=Mucor circinelloides f. lusitanicus TaxID=29924 RepID=A0A8H4EVZ7_MUCCL|nr:hypothetical protein FB192DRAFT_1041187 [Mucor lusitanicus]